MKKTFSRAFSLLLVLALLASVIPSALATDGEGEGNTDPAPTEPVIVVTATATPGSIEVNGSSTLSASVTKGGQPVADASVEWSIKSGAEFIQLSGTKVTGKAAGQATLTAKYMDENNKPHTGDCSVVVSAPAAVVPSGVELDKNTATVGLENAVDLPATIKPDGATGTVQWAITQSSTDGVVTLSATQGNSIRVTGKKDGTATVTASIEGTNHSASCALTVGKITITPTKAADTSVMVENTVPVTVGGLENLPTGTVEVEYTTSDRNIATVDSNGVVTGVKAGDVKITATVTLIDTEKYTLAGATDGKVTFETNVEVVATGIKGGPVSVKAGSTSQVILSVTDEDAKNITYTKTSVKGGGSASADVSITGDRMNITNTDGEGSVVVYLKATYTSGGKSVEVEGSVIIYVYQEHTVRATIKKSPTYLHETDTLAAASIDGDSIDRNLSSYSLRDLLSAPNAMSYELGNVFNAIGSFSDKSFTSLSRDVYFSATKSGTQYCSYNVYARDGSLVSTGVLYLTSGNVAGDITYSTNYNTSITFDEDDFETFWTTAKRNDSSLSGNLSYVTFDINSTYPQYGSLKTSKNGSGVTYNMKFEPNYVSSSKNYDLDAVTYVPSTSMKSETTVTIPFTAYSTTGKHSSGIVSIDLNKETTTITSYGVGFGNGTNSIADYIADTYKANTNTTLGYVTFPSLTASTGKLFYDFSGVLKSREVLSTYKFYAKPTGTQFDLDDVVFVPRAGLYGEVTLYYYAYDASGNNEYKGTIVLNVQQKTKSAGFSDVGTSLSWAADSVDFLNYEGVAEGSGGKYRPSAYITRGDFMLMLYRAFLEDEHKNDSITSNFSDVTKGSDTYSKETYQAVGVAKKLGIAQGTNGKFNPKSYITRQEAMTLIYRTLDEVNYDLDYTVSTSTSSFKDYSSVASYAKTAISDLIGHGIVIGNNSKINPTSNITRAEMAVILHRVPAY